MFDLKTHNFKMPMKNVTIEKPNFNFQLNINTRKWKNNGAFFQVFFSKNNQRDVLKKIRHIDVSSVIMGKSKKAEFFLNNFTTDLQVYKLLV